MPKDIVSLIPIASIDSSTLGVAYLPINATGLPNGCFIVYLTNDSNQDVLISIDGTTTHEVVLQGQRVPLFGQNNSGPGNQKAYFPKGTVFYAKGTAGTGNIYLTASYNPD